MRTVCLVGKPNVGKSSIFNRLIKGKKSIIMDTPGITRDRIYGVANYNNKRFSLIDTGGISLGEDDFSKARNFAIDKANGDYILFLDADEYFVQDCNLKEIITSDNNLYDAYLIKIIQIDILKYKG